MKPGLELLVTGPPPHAVSSRYTAHTTAASMKRRCRRTGRSLPRRFAVALDRPKEGRAQVLLCLNHGIMESCDQRRQDLHISGHRWRNLTYRWYTHDGLVAWASAVCLINDVLIVTSPKRCPTNLARTRPGGDLVARMFENGLRTAAEIARSRSAPSRWHAGIIVGKALNHRLRCWAGRYDPSKAYPMAVHPRS